MVSLARDNGGTISGTTHSNGVHSISREDYDKLARENWSKLKLLSRSPAHYRHNLLVKRKDTDALKRGRVSHVATFEPERFASEVAIWDGGIRRGKLWDSFKLRHDGAELLTADEYDECLAIGAAVRADRLASPYLSGGRAEQTLLWTHVAQRLAGCPGYEIECKGRVDFIAECGAIVDLKTTRNASQKSFGRDSFNFKYHCQAAFYVDGYLAATGKRLPYIIVAVEVEAPHVVAVYRLTDEQLAAGRDEYRSLLDRLYVCKSENKWGGYMESEQDLELPSWSGLGDDESVEGLGLTVGGTE